METVAIDDATANTMEGFIAKVPLGVASLPQSPSHAHSPTVYSVPLAWLLGEKCQVLSDGYAPHEVLGMVV